MRVQVPIYIRDERAKGRSSWLLRPVLHPGPVVRHVDIDRAMQLMAEDLRRLIGAAAARGDHDAIADLVADPGLEDRRVQVSIDTRGIYLAGEVLLAAHPAPGGIACCFVERRRGWFHVDAQRDLGTRVSEMLTPLARELVDEGEDPRQLLAPRRAWIASIDLSVPVDPARERRADDRRASLGPRSSSDGARELDRVGICLGREIGAAPVYGRDAELAELIGFLATRERRSVLLVGPPGVGKSALVQAAAHARRGGGLRGQIWHLAPGRLISGMSYVGEWEARLEAICRHAAETDQILFVDDLVGLMRAGVSSSSSLGVGRVLKGWLEDGRLRLIGEATWEVLHVVQELDRGFADLLRPLPIAPFGEAAAADAVSRLVADLEAGGGCAFRPDGVRSALALSRRYRPDRAMPGAAADLLRALAVRGGGIDRAAALGHFSAVSGIAVELLDATVRADRERLLASLRRGVVGQDEAVQALADALALAKAGMADPERPLQTALFLGPTGVGKTQCARALATTLFGSPDRLLRFDLNEYAGHDAVERLAGSLARPEGALVSAIRRQPYAVVLFDEVEKADPAVFDLLLQVLGEARLTDAVGRTASFANAVIIMTSNLGVREAAGARLGFTGGDVAAGAAYRAAVDAFFRPEFVARIDRIVAFSPLGATELAGIARTALAEAAARPGLARRRWVLQTEAAAIERLVASALADGTGGRAVRRAIAEQVLRPLAERLAVTIGAAPGVARVSTTSAELSLSATAFVPAEDLHLPASAPFAPEKALERCERLRDLLDARRPDGPLELGRVDPALAGQYELAERIDRLRRHLRSRCDRLRRRRGVVDHEPDVDGGRPIEAAGLWRAWCAGESLAAALDASPEGARLERAEIELTLLEHAVAAGDQTVIVRLRDPAADADDPRAAVARGLLEEWRAFALSLTELGSGRWSLAGPGADMIAASALGAHLIIDAAGAISPLVVERDGEGAMASTASTAVVARIVDLPSRRVCDLAVARWGEGFGERERARAWIALRVAGSRS
jgi:ATP-dependent Clp protease ATP-binding subunit ClpA